MLCYVMLCYVIFMLPHVNWVFLVLRLVSNPRPGKRNQDYEAAALPLCYLATVFLG